MKKSSPPRASIPSVPLAPTHHLVLHSVWQRVYAGCEVLAISPQGQADGLPVHENVQRRKSDLKVRPSGFTTTAARVCLLGELHPRVLVQVRWHAKAWGERAVDMVSNGKACKGPGSRVWKYWKGVT